MSVVLQLADNELQKYDLFIIYIIRFNLFAACFFCFSSKMIDKATTNAVNIIRKYSTFAVVRSDA